MAVPNITIRNGAYAADGGSVSLTAIDTADRKLHILLDWSIRAQQTGATFLVINGVKLEPGSADEIQWIEALRHAQITGDQFVAMLREDILQKLESPCHKRRAPSNPGPPPNKLPLP